MDPLDTFDDFMAVPETLSDSAHPQAPLSASLYAPGVNSSNPHVHCDTPLRPLPPPLITPASDEGYASTVQAWAHAFYRAVDQVKASEPQASKPPVTLSDQHSSKQTGADAEEPTKDAVKESEDASNESKSQDIHKSEHESKSEDAGPTTKGGEDSSEHDDEDEADESDEEDSEEVADDKIRRPQDLPFSPDEVTIRDLFRGHVAINCGQHEVHVPVLLSLLIMSIIGLSPATFFVTIGFGVPVAWFLNHGFAWLL